MFKFRANKTPDKAPAVARQRFPSHPLQAITTLAAGIFAAVVSPAILAKTAKPESTKRPNILFIMSDDHGYQAIGAYGSKVNQTPNIDRIAKDGMRFDRCFVTNSICGPCRATILTGKYSHLNGFARNGDRFYGEQQHVAKLLQAAGYQTAVIGKWHLATDPTGFDYWHILQGQGPYYNPVMLTPDGKVEHIGYTTDVITDEALSWLKEKRDEDKPFFLMYQHKAPHRNWQPGPKYLTKYDDTKIPEPETLYDDYCGRGTAAKTQAMTVANHLSDHDLKLAKQRGKFTEEQLDLWNAAYGPKNEEFRKAKLQGKELIQWKYQRYAKDYLRCVDAVDENVGRVLDYLKDSGLEENTVVIYTSDQGWYLGEHGWYDKRWMYEESFRTPLLIRWPGTIKAGSIDKTMVMNLDFAETFLEIAGVSVPDDMQGRSMVPVLKGATPDDWRKSVYYRYYEFPGPHSVRKHYGIRTERYKLIHFHEIDEWELYDLEKDPHELNSVFADPKHAELVKELQTELQRLQDKYKDDDSVVRFNKVKAKKVKLELVQQFAAEEPAALSDKPIAQVDSADLDSSLKPLMVGGWIKPDNDSGVLIAQGGGAQGFSLYLQDGTPMFATRSNGQLSTVKGAEIPNGDWVHLAAALDAEGNGQIFINGQPSGDAQPMEFIARRPAEGLSVGLDSGDPVSSYAKATNLMGHARDLRLYWGVLPNKQLLKWAQTESTEKHVKVKDGMRVMFNGKDLTGWKPITETYFKKGGTIKVVDGEIEIGKGKPGTGIIVDGDNKKKLLRINYEIELDAKRTDGSDFFCGMTFPIKDEYLSMIIGGWGGKVTGLSNLNNLSAIENETTGVIDFENDKWYHIKLRVTEEKVEAWLDDERIISVDLKDKELSIWWEQEPVRPLGISTWYTEARVKNITVTDLSKQTDKAKPKESADKKTDSEDNEK